MVIADATIGKLENGGPAPISSTREGVDITHDSSDSHAGAMGRRLDGHGSGDHQRRSARDSNRDRTSGGMAVYLASVLVTAMHARKELPRVRNLCTRLTGKA